MKVLMTGATGFVGTEGVSRLLHQGHSVRILTRRPELARNQLPAEVDVHSWNPAEVPSADRF
ncbi:MAG: NAD-dependent epimerase/dehydratase family protein, partial [Nitrospinaceae bacterium]|nr:NAD-dependent epimerase/dehydratase family protein [Nitrospinaceae bacterium]NIR55591.1 NAD-dependent epimerase/dehydratase family protein [Nitrospinaceae bacterium]NIS86025.1 NAD-dependent epimerase/dehydratase family protein [Nitrospinaceae bacterium]NIT83347.1 NAD-dependent epimerase/dehydratase family protein [Nitrospinaceae bacterium]NIU45073.1 NAD-dependent epimerase/dehydratase family protein [Nitrospinaceae bacterium]